MLVRVGSGARGPGARPHDPPADAHRARGDREGHQGQEEGRVAVHRKGSAYRNTPVADPLGRGGSLTPKGGGRAVVAPPGCPYPRPRWRPPTWARRPFASVACARRSRLPTRTRSPFAPSAASISRSP